MIEIFGKLVVVAFAMFLLVLGLLAFTHREKFQRFLLSFAKNGPLHFLELAIRALTGVAFLVSAPELKFGVAFGAVGWILLATTAVIALVPWKLHRKFAQWSVPKALAFTPLIGLSSLAMGGFVLLSVIYGHEA
jgi:hypothetical protein